MQLSHEEQELLQSVTDQRAPELSGLVMRIGTRPLTDDERDSLREALAAELSARGLRPDDEPNEYGLTIDALIGRLSHF